MRFLLRLFVTFAIAVTVGLGATWIASSRGVSFGAVGIGAWRAWPRIGTPGIDPYARAVIARSGELPLASGDGLAFLARFDDAGRALNGRCDVTIAGTTAQARYWTLSLYTPEGGLAANALGRHGFTSQEIVRHSDGSFEIAAAPFARPGNWLPTGEVLAYQLVLRLYDSAVGVVTRVGRESPMPAISTGTCR